MPSSPCPLQFALFLPRSLLLIMQYAIIKRLAIMIRYRRMSQTEQMF